jgi:hypothetical protein
MNEIKLISVCDPANQTELLRENVPDSMDAEQTWPTEEEIAHSRTGNFFVCIYDDGTLEISMSFIYRK